MLERAEEVGPSNVVTWLPHMRGFIVKNVEQFITDVVPQFFGQTTFPQFICQLRAWGFHR